MSNTKAEQSFTCEIEYQQESQENMDTFVRVLQVLFLQHQDMDWFHSTDITMALNIFTLQTMLKLEQYHQGLLESTVIQVRELLATVMVLQHLELWRSIVTGMDMTISIQPMFRRSGQKLLVLSENIAINMRELPVISSLNINNVFL